MSEKDKSRWKSKLVSTSIPLEFEVAKTAVAAGFSTAADFNYAREDEGLEKDFSVDIHAVAFHPFNDANVIDMTLEVLIECKQRKPEVAWLFLPDPNLPEFSAGTLGRTLRCVDEFSTRFFEPNATVAFDDSLAFCYKGVEIDRRTGTAHDAEVRKGICQLQYALPRLLASQAMFNLSGHEEDNHPFIYCPILLTTAPLVVADPAMTVNDVERTSGVEELGEQVPYLVVVQGYGPDFERHCSKQIPTQLDLPDQMVERLLELNAFRKAEGEPNFQLPASLLQDLSNGSGYALRSHFTQFLVCTKAALPELLQNLKLSADGAAKAMTHSGSESSAY